MFSSTPNQVLYTTIQELISQNLIPEINLIDNYLKAKQLDLKIGGRDYLNYLYKQPYSLDNFREFERLVVNSYKARTLISLSAAIPHSTLSTNDVNSVIENIRQQLDNLTNTGGGEQTARLEDVLKLSWDGILDRVKNPGIRGTSTGYTSVDLSTSGFNPGDLIIIAGRPGMGKSAVKCNMMINQAKKGIPTQIFSLEMRKEALVERMLAVESEVPSQNIKLGLLNKDQLEKISETIKGIKSYPILIDANYSADLDYILASIRKQVNMKGIKVVYVDYLQLLAERGNEATHELGKITRAFKRLANELGITIVAGSQLNRGVELRDDKRPLLGDLRQSGNIEEDADVVFGVYRDVVYRPNTKDKTLLEFMILKNRQGPVGTVPLNFYEEYTKITDRL